MVFKFQWYFISILVICLLIIDNYTTTLLSSGTFIFAKTDKTSRVFLRMGGFVPVQQSAALSRFQNRRIFPTSKSSVLCRIHYNRSVEESQG